VGRAIVGGGTSAPLGAVLREHTANVEERDIYGGLASVQFVFVLRKSSITQTKAANARD